jgi:hypothetical protein
MKAILQLNKHHTRKKYSSYLVNMTQNFGSGTGSSAFLTPGSSVRDGKNLDPE